jgi:hypothetical protein
MTIGYTDEIKKYKKIMLGETEIMFLDIYSNRTVSAYEITQILENSGMHMSYKNVHRRVKRLTELQLIKKDSVDPKHMSIIYKITAQGIFQMLLEGHLFFTNWLIKNHKDPILHAILFQFFCEETIQKFNTLARLKVLADYLKKCCEGILAIISAFQSSYNQNKRSSHLEYAINELIQDELRNFIFQIISVKKLPVRDFGLIDYNKPWFSEVGNEKELIQKTDPDYSEAFPKATLMRDRKFMKLLSEIKSDFETGCKDYFIGT